MRWLTSLEELEPHVYSLCLVTIRKSESRKQKQFWSLYMYMSLKRIIPSRPPQITLHARVIKTHNPITCAADHATCTCPRGYTGAACEKGPCHSNPCHNGGQCKELNGDYFCECTTQFSGRHCTKECPAKNKDGFPEKLDIMFLLDGSGSVGPR